MGRYPLFLKYLSGLSRESLKIDHNGHKVQHNDHKELIIIYLTLGELCVSFAFFVVEILFIQP